MGGPDRIHATPRDDGTFSCRRLNRSPHSDNGFDVSGNVAGWLVFPHPDYNPPSLDEPPVGIGVPISIPFDLCRPILRVCGSSRPPVLWATMPETSVYVDGDSRATEDNVCPTPKALQRRAVHPITETRRMQQTTDRHFGLRVACLLHLHSCSDARRARVGLQVRIWSANTHAAGRSAVAA